MNESGKSFGGWLANRRASRVGLIAGFLPLGLLGILSAAIVVTVAELKGWREAAIDCLIALAMLALLMMLLGGDWAQLAATGASAWVAAIALGVLTGAYASLTLSLQAILVFAMFGVIGFALIVGDPIVFWQKFLGGVIADLEQFGIEFAEPDALLALAPMMTGIVAASGISSSILALLLGSWWASRATGPDFKSMFLQIRLGYVIGIITLLASLAALLGLGFVAANLLMVLGVGFVFQGLSIVHWHAAARGWPGIYLIPVYLPFFMGGGFVVATLFLLAAIGFVDNWFGLRRTGADVV
jgi:hypothetical protein